jgi:N-acetylglucosamine-6-phosphate deacetylase
LDDYCKECDFVVHLAGVNRPETEAEFMEGNFGFASELLENLKKYNNNCPILVSSSIQAELDNPYGRSKKAGEDLMFNYGKETGAKIQGIYLEGPYFTEKYKGAQNPDYMRDPSWEEFQTWQEASNHMIKKIALAPERTGVEEFIERVTETGVVVALGHSNATYVEASSAVDTGASVWVHAYNGMREMTHRELGMVGSMYTVPNTIAELICDGFHVHPKAVEVLVKQKGHEHIALISDCMRAGGMPDGDYSLGEFPVYVKDGVARLKDTGNLAGSVLKLVDGVKNVINWGVVSPDEAIRMASLIPAQSSGIDQMCGQIKKGLAADFLVLDNQFELQATYINGEKKYQI